MTDPKPDKPLSELLPELLETSLLYARQQLTDAADRALLRPLRKAGKSLGWLLGAVTALILAMSFLGVGAVWGLGAALGGCYWGALLICGAVFVPIGIALFAVGGRAVREEPSDHEPDDAGGPAG